MATVFYPSLNATAPYIPDTAWELNEADPYDLAALSWTEIVASTPENWAGFGVLSSGEDKDAHILHIAIGAAGSEVIVATFPASTSPNQRWAHFAPISIPAGTRLSVVFVGTSQVTNPIQIWGLTEADAGGASNFTRVDTGPFLLQNSGGQLYERPILDQPLSVDVFGSWTEISQLSTTASINNNRLNGNSLAHEYAYLMPLMDFTDTANNTIVDVEFELGVGAAGSEVAVSSWGITYNSNQPTRNIINMTGLPIVWGYPAGSRVSARYRVSSLAVNIEPKMVLSGVR